nr:E3 ubiquitin-protein ligase MYCBP2 [Ciona intestinalis]|eukprot:XP_026691648.1 E3 ubiquitin-protein ligase MYCBP2 [Ciona intestinalis]
MQGGKKKDDLEFNLPQAEGEFPGRADPSSPFLNKLGALYQQSKASKKSVSPCLRKSKLSSKNVPSRSDIVKERNKMFFLPLQQLKLSEDTRKAIQISCGAHHTLVLMDDGSVCAFGQNNHGQLGVKGSSIRTIPTFLDIDLKVVRIATGSYHSLFLTDHGILLGCGGNADGQLGDNVGAADVLTPTVIFLFQQHTPNTLHHYRPRVTWMGASHNNTFVKYEEVLLDSSRLDETKVFGNQSYVGISYSSNEPQSSTESMRKSDMLLIEKQSGICRHFDQSCSIDTSGDIQVCMDAAHDVIWSMNPHTWTISSHMLSGYQTNNMSGDAMSPFSPQVAIPLSSKGYTTRTLAGLNLLACIDTLATRCPHGMETDNEENSTDGSTNTLNTKGKADQHTAEEYSIVNRFKSHGGGWGYSVHSTEAIRFMCDADVLLGGIGVFGGRGEYSVTVCVYEEVGDAEAPGDGDVLVETDRIPYECGSREKFHAIFNEPIPVTAGQWYTVTAKVTGPSSDCGSHGEQNVTTSDNIKFTFRRSKRSNNGTDVSAGQIPELLYCLPPPVTSNETEVVTKSTFGTPVQVVTRDFYMSFTESVFDSLPYLIEWTRTSLFEDISKKASRFEKISKTDETSSNAEEVLTTEVIRDLAFVFAVCLRLLRITISQTLSINNNESGNLPEFITQATSLIEIILTDGELDAAMDDAQGMPALDRDLVMSSAITTVTECHQIMLECIETLQPTPPRKWAYLHQALESYNMASPQQKTRQARLLVLVLDALCQPSVDLVQCLPLFPRTLSNLASVASAAQSPNVDAVDHHPTHIETPVSSAAGFYDVAHSLVEIACLSTNEKTEQKRKIPLQISPNKKFNRLLLDPHEAVVSSTCKLLVTLTSDLSYRAVETNSSLSLTDDTFKSDKSIFTIYRFDHPPVHRNWKTGNGTPDAICFNVEATGVYVVGFGVYGGGHEDHRYEIELFEQNGNGGWETLDLMKGTYRSHDYGKDHVINVMTNKPISIKKSQIYSIRLRNYGGRTCNGVHGKASVKGPDGTKFNFTHCPQSSNGTTVRRGQLPSILYRRTPSDDELPASPGDKWVGTATTPATAGLAYQRHALNILALVSESAIDIFNTVGSEDENEIAELENEIENLQVDSDSDNDLELNQDALHGSSGAIVKRNISTEKMTCKRMLGSKLVSYLLPNLFSNIGVLVRRNAHCSVEVMDLIRDLLPPLINIQRTVSDEKKKSDPESFTLVVESKHPYKAASVIEHRATFQPCVSWMVLEFNNRCQTGQPEDFLQLYLPPSNTEHALNPVLNKMSQDKNWPQNSILLPGHEVVFRLETASDYTNSSEQKPHLFYGFRCVITGYQTLPDSCADEGLCLVSEMINVAGFASINLMKVHFQLWAEDESESNFSSLSLDEQEDRREHLKAIESTASVTLEHHPSLFLPGLHLDSFPGASEALTGNLPISEGSKERTFLLDFVSATPETSGGRLARWLQPDSYVDPSNCLLRLNTKTLIHTLPTSITIITRDQYGKSVHVPTLKVELSARPHSAANMHANVGVIGPLYAATPDISPTTPTPSFEARYEVTKHRDSKYHSITMMRAYKKYSFEELRLAYPLKKTLKTETILVAGVGDGVYRATWIPSLVSTYTLQVTLDQKLKGPRHIVDVVEAPHGCTEQPRLPTNHLVEASSTKLRRFATRNSRGLRIRSNPTLQSPQIGLLKYDDIIEFTEEIRNTDGSWVKLGKASCDKYCSDSTIVDAWCISHHKHNGRTFLVPVEKSSPKIEEVDKKDDPTKPPIVVDQASSAQQHPSFSSSLFGASSSTPSKSSDLFPTLFSPTAPKTKDFRGSGEYQVIKCGVAGHNIRYNPNIKSPPIGKLVSGNSFMSVDVTTDKTGIWLLMHSTQLTKFCLEAQEAGHGWTLAVTHDGTQYLQSVSRKSRSSTNLNTPETSVNLNVNMSNGSLSESAIRGAALAKLTNPFTDPQSKDGDAVDLLLASSPSFKDHPEEGRKLEVDDPSSHLKEKIKKHHRSSSDSEVQRSLKSKTNGEKKLPDPLSSLRGRSSSATSNTRSHSSPRTKKTSHNAPLQRTASSQRLERGGRKSSLGRRDSGSSDGAKKKTFKKSPTKKTTASASKEVAKSLKDHPNDGARSKSIRGGVKKVEVAHMNGGEDIPFIDDVVDVEGNILSPSKQPVNQTKLSTAASGAIPKKEIPRSKMFHSQLKKETPVKLTNQQKTYPHKINRSETSEALSPLVAECARAVFAAFVWHEGIVHDAMACSSFLKFNRTQRSQIMKHVTNVVTEGTSTPRRSSDTSSNTQEGSSNEWSQPPGTLVYLAMIWVSLSETITKLAVRNQNLLPPVPSSHNLNSQKDATTPPPSKAPKRKRANIVANGFNDLENKKYKDMMRFHDVTIQQLRQRRNNQQPPAIRPFMPFPTVQDGRGDHFKDIVCDLCDKMQPYPVTYHMKQSHPGCGKFAGGLGYNSSGHYCGGWAGDCGDGGVGGSTWFLLCITCRESYLTNKKSATSPSTSKNTNVKKGSSNWANKLHKLLLQPTSAHQVMKDNAMFLLNLVSAARGPHRLFEHKNKNLLSGHSSTQQDKWLENVGASLNDDDMWIKTEQPTMSLAHSPFPNHPCAYLQTNGKDTVSPITNTIPPIYTNSRKLHSGAEYRSRSLSNQLQTSTKFLKHSINRLSVTPDSSPQKTESSMFLRRNRLMRSVSTGSQPNKPDRHRISSSGDASITASPSGTFLLHQPSASMKRLMRGGSGNNNDIAGRAVHGSNVISFVTQRHDLKSLQLTLQMTLRRAALRVYVLQALTWLLRTVITESSIHNILWYFVSALTEANQHPGKDESKNKINDENNDDEMEQETKPLCEHPVKDMALAGIDSMQPLVEAFHGFLQTVSDIMMHLPANSPVQLMAIRCWSLRVLPSDHQFLHQSQVFSHISQILSKVDCNEEKQAKRKKLMKIKPGNSAPKEVENHDGKVTNTRDITTHIHIKTSSHPSIANSLTDGSTETFWESGDEDKNKVKSITLNMVCDKDGRKKEIRDVLPHALYVHIDNTRDIQKKVTSISFSSEIFDEDKKKKLQTRELSSQYAGWVHCPLNEDINILQVELRGPDNGLRVRQIKLLGILVGEGMMSIQQLPSNTLRAQTCEAELLKVFKLLTAEVFGQLLSETTPTSNNGSPAITPPDEVGGGETSKVADLTPSSPRDVDPNLREHMVGILFSRSKLTSLQKKVFEHTVHAIHTEAAHIRKVWENNLQATSVQCVKSAEQSDTYCFELLSMILALSGSDVGCHYVAQQSLLVQDIVSLLHTGTPRVQRQVTLLLRRILSEVPPDRLASIISAKVPTQDKLRESITESSSSSSFSSQDAPPSIRVLDPFFACIAKALHVQVKGGSPQLQSADSANQAKKARAVELKTVFSGRPEKDSPTWWMHGTIQDKSIVESVIKLLKDMSAGQIGLNWSSVTKCAVSEAILPLTRLSEMERESEHCLATPTLWQALGALCALDHDHVDKLSSARSNQQKNKLTCANHDDGVTQAIVQCSDCGNLCSECDRYLHLHRRTQDHQRQVFKEEEESIRVDLHEGCGRIKLFWLMALADSNTMKAIVEFKGRTPGQRQPASTGVCRFCGSTSDSGQLAINNVCLDEACQSHAAMACSKSHSCGHMCGGVRDEETCLPCLHTSCTPSLKQDGDDMCMVCFTDELSAAPAIQLECGHIFHYHCCEMQLKKQWAGPRITFGFMLCSICKTEIKHSSLAKYLNKIEDLMSQVKRKALQRLEYEGLNECESITAVGGRFYQNPTGFALNKYAYYMCYKCNKAYYGGEVRCDAEAGVEDLFDPKELICGACSDVACAQICPKHGTDFLEYKCRYCCSVAVYFCFGTTHFCQPCHDDFQRITALQKSALPHCPAGQKAQQLEGKECPLHVEHPPTGEEFALGCGVCRNAHTF